RADLDGIAGEVGAERLVPQFAVAAEVATGLTRSDSRVGGLTATLAPLGPLAASSHHRVGGLTATLAPLGPLAPSSDYRAGGLTATLAPLGPLAASSDSRVGGLTATLAPLGPLAASEELVPEDVDLLGGGPVHELDERVAGDLLGEPDAAGALDAPLAVQQHLGGDVDRLGEGPLDVAVAGVRPAGGHGLVLQRALPALVAHRAVERVVDQEELHDPRLCLAGHIRAEGGAHPAPAGQT